MGPGKAHGESKRRGHEPRHEVGPGGGLLSYLGFTPFAAGVKNRADGILKMSNDATFAEGVRQVQLGGCQIGVGGEFLGAAAAIGAGVAELAAGAAAAAARGTTALGRGSTASLSKGTTLPRTLREQLAIEQAMRDPTAGRQLTRLKMTDPRWPAEEGWVKMRQRLDPRGREGEIEVHYVLNSISGAVDDFKIVLPGAR